MLRQSWSYWFYVLLAWLLLLILPALFFFGQWDAVSIEEFFRPILAKFGMKRLDTDSLLKIGSFIFAIISGAFTLWRLWHFHELQLPQRLQEYLEECRQAAIAEREENLRLAASPTMREALPGKVTTQTAPLKRLLRQFEIDQQSGNQKIDDLQRELTVIADTQSVIEHCKATEHFIRANRTRRQSQSPASAASRLQISNDLEQAASLGRSDISLQKAFLSHAEEQGQLDMVSKAISGWILASDISNEPRQEGLARKKNGEYWYGRTLDPTLMVGIRNERLWSSCNELTSSVTLLQNNPETRTPSSRDLTLAETLQLLGDVRVALDTRQIAEARYNDALDIYRATSNGHGIQEILEKLASNGLNVRAVVEAEESPQAKLVRAQIELARARISTNLCIDAQTLLNDTSRRCLSLEAPGDIGQTERSDLMAQISTLLQRACVKSPTPKP